MQKLFTLMLFIGFQVNLFAQEVYHFPKEENWSLGGDCFDELRAIQKKAEARTAQYEADAEDYKKEGFAAIVKGPLDKLKGTSICHSSSILQMGPAEEGISLQQRIKCMLICIKNTEQIGTR